MLREPQRTIHQPRQPEDSSAQRNTVEETPAPHRPAETRFWFKCPSAERATRVCLWPLRPYKGTSTLILYSTHKNIGSSTHTKRKIRLSDVTLPSTVSNSASRLRRSEMPDLKYTMYQSSDRRSRLSGI